MDKRKERQELKRINKEKEKYNPKENIRELNPYWKNGGDGLPLFKKPSEEHGASSSKTTSRSQNTYGRWKKKTEEESNQTSIKTDDKISSNKSTNITTTTDLNVIAAKLLKAEIMGNDALVAELKEKLERAKELNDITTNQKHDGDEILLTKTDSRGFSKPLNQSSMYGESSSGMGKRKVKTETHSGKERVRYFADDDNYSLKQMFENEKYNSIEEQNEQFMKLAGKMRKNDDLDDIFADNIRQMDSDERKEKRERDKAISQHKRIADSVDNCRKCLESSKIAKNLLITIGDCMYISLPEHQPLTDGHCIISSIRHVYCGTQLDENEWADLMDYRKRLTKMFLSIDKDVIFFESAKNLHKYPHMYLECVPVDKETGDLAPIYFKKAIDESEREWSTNKKLVSLAGRDVRKAVPKGLPYFCVSFGMQEGYAHVIEDRDYFPDNFAQEIIGGMLDLPHDVWRRPKHEDFNKQSKRVQEFNRLWKEYKDG